jgi:hypothetical protein
LAARAARDPAGPGPLKSNRSAVHREIKFPRRSRGRQLRAIHRDINCHAETSIATPFTETSIAALFTEKSKQEKGSYSGSGRTGFAPDLSFSCQIFQSSVGRIHAVRDPAGRGPLKSNRSAVHRKEQTGEREKGSHSGSGRTGFAPDLSFSWQIFRSSVGRIHSIRDPAGRGPLKSNRSAVHRKEQTGRKGVIQVLEEQDLLLISLSPVRSSGRLSVEYTPFVILPAAVR